MDILKRFVMVFLLTASPFLFGAAANPDNTPQKDTAAKPPQASPAEVKKEKAEPEARPPQATPAVYKPPLRGSPGGRVGGGTRSVAERESFSLFVLAPDHVGLTVNERPCLYWFISKSSSYPAELTVTEARSVKPILETVLPSPKEGGIQQACLADYNVSLRPDVVYKWFVTLVTDADRRSRDILAGGMIRRVEASPDMKKKLPSVSAREQFFIYAQEGLWYDAVESISKGIRSSPDDTGLRAQRVNLLEEAGLREVADFYKK